MKKFKQILLLLCVSATLPIIAQNVVITGTITDDLGPLAGANVHVVNEINRPVGGAIADGNGQYRIAIPDNKKLRIVCSFIGYKTQAVPYTGAKVYNFRLADESVSLQDVVITEKAIQRDAMGLAPKEIVSATQKISMEMLESAPVTSVEEALQGRMANVDIIVGADPGSKSAIRIRGTASLNASSDPLIVVDGVEYPTSISDDFNFSTAEDEDFGALVNLSPADIESIEVLKDAAATAIWGSKGSAGVLLITTKKGVKGKTNFTFNTKWDFKKEPNTIPMLNGKQYLSLLQDSRWNRVLQEADANILYDLYNDPQLNGDPDYIYATEFNQETDWLKEVTRSSINSDNSFSMTGGGDRATYRASINYAKELGTTKGTDFDRFSASTRVDYKFSDKFKVAANFSFTQSNRTSNWSDPRGMALTKMPNMSPYFMIDQNTRSTEYFTMYSTLQGSFNDANGSGQYNPVAMVNESFVKQQQRNARYIFDLEYKIIPGLTYFGTVGFDVRTTKTKKFLPGSVTGLRWDSPYFNRAEDGMSDNLFITTRNRLNYRWNKYKNHVLNVMGQIETGESMSSNYSSVVSGVASTSMSDPTAGGTPVSMGSSQGRSRNVRVAANANYTLFERYVLNAGIGLEGNSNLSRSSRWGTTPNLGLAWNIHEEPFLRDLMWLENAKLRYGWGRTGRAPSGSFPFLGVFVTGEGYIDMPTYQPDRMQLENLKWEYTISNNVGLDVGFFKGNLTATFDYYKYVTRDLLQKSMSIPSSTGYTSILWYNSGAMSNEGVEFRVDYVALRNKDWTVSVNFNIARNENRVLELPDNMKFENYVFGNGKYAHKIVEGNPIGSFYGYKYKGVYQNIESTYAKDAKGNPIKDVYGNQVYMKNGDRKVYPGDAIYEDINYDGVINNYDICYLGNAMPLFTGGGGFSVRYKAFTLNAFFYGRVGQKIVNRARMNFENMSVNDNQAISVLRRWRNEGDQTDIPRAYYSTSSENRHYNYLGSDRYVEDGSYVRLKNATIKYAVPQKALKAWRINRLDVYLTGYDLFTFTNYKGQDPEVSLSSDPYMLSQDNATTPRGIRFAAGLLINF